MSDYQVALTLKSGNTKTGPIPVSTTTFATCPDACALRANGCYAAGGPLAIHWKAVTEGRRGMAWKAFCEAIAALPAGTLWRHNQAGDLPGDRTQIDNAALYELCEANAGRRGFTYTHYDPGQGDNAALIWAANREGFTVNLSADNLDQADRLAALNIGPVVALLEDVAPEAQPTHTPAGRRVVVCPATYKDDINCATCQLCQRQRDSIVGFPVHGSGKAKAAIVRRAPR